ncbi:MAG: GntP family permease [Bacteroidetes bacterium]|nr:MAG: GntP family permease [Bacteroidota bacterium]
MIWSLFVLLLTLVLLVVSISKWNVHPFFALLLAALALGVCLGLGGAHTVEVVLTGFGNTMKWIAMVVVLGAFIGEVLRETGGALRISDKLVKWLGERRLPWALGLTGYLVSIPVFVDVAYIVLQPITEALSVRSRRPVLVLGLALAAGLTVSHTLIPPTPGPLAVAALLEVNMGRMLLVNTLAGVFAMAAGILWAVHFCRAFHLPYDDQLRVQEVQPRPTGAHAPVVMDLLPILVPIGLMGLGAFLEADTGRWPGEVLALLSTPLIAVLVGAGIAALQYGRAGQPGKLSKLAEQAIVKSALVIMITGAGGAFGHVIRESGVQDHLGSFLATVPALGFLLPFLIAAVLTTATGSITVSLIGTASIVAPMADSMPCSPEIMAALIGCGSFCVFHANSSFFWLLNRLHDVPVPVLYRTFTPQSLVMGLAGLLAVLLMWSLGLA